MPRVNKTTGKRDYSYDTKYETSPKQIKARTERVEARRIEEKNGKVSKGDGMDVDHRKPVSKGGTNAKSNLRVEPKSDNRSFSRNSDSSLKRNVPKKK